MISQHAYEEQAFKYNSFNVIDQMRRYNLIDNELALFYKYPITRVTEKVVNSI